MNLKKITAFISAAALALSLTACSNDHYTKDGGEITTAIITEDGTVMENGEVRDALDPGLIADREGGTVQVPVSISTIVSTAPSITEILVGLGLTEKIIAADLYSSDVTGIDPSICTIDFYNLNIEELAVLSPDVIIISGMSMGGGDDPYTALKDAGINVIYVPTSDSIASIKQDIEFLAAYTKTEKKGEALITDIDSAVNDISAKAKEVTVKKSVYFEIGEAPYLYSCGSGTFINEAITLAGGENIYASETGWLSNSEESVIAADPDVIITNVSYDGYDFNEIKTRPGWENITAVKNGDVYKVDANTTGRPSQHIVDGLYEIARAIYPDIYYISE
ncbi:MAG: ABC transporter substrate-binding protein [Oscillospiraceae bacterium]|nr:ABC transporter substrate-binding protein [Oscillospiraceae bacterium]